MRWLLIFLSLVAATPALAQTPDAMIPAPVIAGGRLGKSYAPLIERLRSERLVLLFRHDRTEVTGRWDFEPYVAGGCNQQRALSEAGRASARAIGAAIHLLEVPVRRVIASPYCRAIESARLMFGGVHSTAPALIGADGKARTLDIVRTDITKLLERDRPERGLLALIAHHGTIDLFTSRMLDEGDALVLNMNATGSIEVVAHMPAARWEEIARDVDRQRFEASSN